MVKVPGGTFLMGSPDFYPEERPVRRVTVEEFWMDAHPVTNDDFHRFVKDTGYVTVAERPVSAIDYPGADPSLLVPGSLVFRKASGPVDLADVRNWWSYTPGASWSCPEGPGSDLSGRETHPVVHVAYEDARSYAEWAGKELPSEAEWERAARGGLPAAAYAWGDQLTPGGHVLANIWIGEFPWRRQGDYERTSPVGSFPPNGYGLYDMIGNVWEWTTTRFAVPAARGACCAGGAGGAGGNAREKGDEDGPVKVVKGGSYLCAPNYCRRYRPAARQPQTVDTATSHMGLRCVKREQAAMRS